jgi:hypothetical protein
MCRAAAQGPSVPGPDPGSLYTGAAGRSPLSLDTETCCDYGPSPWTPTTPPTTSPFIDLWKNAVAIASSHVYESRPFVFVPFVHKAQAPPFWSTDQRKRNIGNQMTTISVRNERPSQGQHVRI